MGSKASAPSSLPVLRACGRCPIHFWQREDALFGHSLAVQWVRLCAFTVVSSGLIPAQGTTLKKREREKERKQEDPQLKLTEFNETENKSFCKHILHTSREVVWHQDT